MSDHGEDHIEVDPDFVDNEAEDADETADFHDVEADDNDNDNDDDGEDDEDGDLGMAQQVRTKPIEIPRFYGGGEDADGKPTIAVKAWLRQVDYCRTLGAWDSARTASHAVLALVGQAQAWLDVRRDAQDNRRIARWENIQMAGGAPEGSKDHYGLRMLLHERFYLTVTIADKAKLVSNLKMKSDESVLDFLDRCHRTHYDVRTTWRTTRLTTPMYSSRMHEVSAFRF